MLGVYGPRHAGAQSSDFNVTVALRCGFASNIQEQRESPGHDSTGTYIKGGDVPKLSLEESFW